jgi:predicted GIY-YIG superfamily endonuclease
VYQIEWDDPKQLYIGRTRRSLDVRYAEHENEDTPVGRAIREEGPDRAFVVEEFDTLEEAKREEARLILINRIIDGIHLLND